MPLRPPLGDRACHVARPRYSPARSLSLLTSLKTRLDKHIRRSCRGGAASGLLLSTLFSTAAVGDAVSYDARHEKEGKGVWPQPPCGTPTANVIHIVLTFVCD